LNRKTKEEVVAELHEVLKETKWAVLSNYRGMNVEKITALRNALRKSQTELRVVKNTLLRIAAQGTAISVLNEQFKGPLAVALTPGDAVEPTKVLVEFAKKNAELEINCGMLNGKFLTKDQISALAELPSREILLGQLLSVLVGAQTGLVNVLSGVPRSFVQVLNAYRESKESA
jgi:large subunit ribosomal protein L10